MRGEPGSRPRARGPGAHVRLFCRQFSSPASCSPLPPSCLGDVELWMLKGSSSFRQDFSESCSLWGALGSSCGRERGQGRAVMGAALTPGTQMSPPQLRWWHWGHRGAPGEGTGSDPPAAPRATGASSRASLGACASHGHIPAATPPSSPPEFSSQPRDNQPVPEEATGVGFIAVLSVQPVPRAAGKAGHASLFPMSPLSISPRQGRAVPARSRSTAGSGCAARSRTGAGWALARGLPGRAPVLPMLPVPLGERRRDGDTHGPLSHKDRILHLLGSDVRPVRSWRHRLHRCWTPKNPGALTLLTPPHPRSAASQAPRAEPSSSGGDEGRVRARHRVHPEVHPVGSGEGPAPEPPARATAAKGARKTGNTGHGWGKAKGTYAPPPARAPQSPSLLSVPSRKTGGWEGIPGDARGCIPTTAASRSESSSGTRSHPLVLPSDATAREHGLPRLSPP